MSKLFTKERREKTRKYYGSYNWKKVRCAQLKKQGLCEICLKSTPKKLTPAKVCDHVKGWTDWESFISGPFMSLCRECHQEKTSFYDIPRMIKEEKTKIKIIDV